MINDAQITFEPDDLQRAHTPLIRGHVLGDPCEELLHLSTKGPTHGIEVTEDQFHTLVALEADSVIFELKQGPYQPAQDKDFLDGFPKEGTTEAARQESQWRGLF